MSEDKDMSPEFDWDRNPDGVLPHDDTPIRREEPSIPVNPGTPDPEAFVRGVERVLEGRVPTPQRRERVSEIEVEYSEYLKQERWADSEPISIPAKSQEWPSFYREMTSEQRDIFRIRLEINKAAWWKRSRGGQLNGYGGMGEGNDQNPIASITESELQHLYKEMPGYADGLRLWIHILEHPEMEVPAGSRNINIRQMRSKGDAEAFRSVVEQNIQLRLSKDPRYSSLNDAERRRLSVDAGNTAFLTLYFMNVFEVHGRSQWKDNVLDVSGINAEAIRNSLFVQPGLAEQLDRYRTVLFNAFQGDSNVATNGQMGPWLDAQIRERGIVWNNNRKDFDRIQLLPATKQAEKQYWRIKGGTLYLPEFYAVNGTMGSMLDFAKNGNRTFYQLMTGRNADDIDWNAASGLTVGYLSQARQMQKLDEYHLGQHQFSEIAKSPGESWDGVLYKVINKFPALKTVERMRWLAYASHEIDDRPKVVRKHRGPKISGNYTEKITYEGIMRDSEFLDRPFHPWDSRGIPKFF